MNLWRLADRYHRRLDRQRTAATHGVEERLSASVASQPQDGGSEPARLDAVVERVNTIGTVFLGLTLG